MMENGGIFHTEIKNGLFIMIKKRHYIIKLKQVEFLEKKNAYHNYISKTINSITIILIKKKEKHTPIFRTWADPEKDSPNITFRTVVRDPKD